MYLECQGFTLDNNTSKPAEYYDTIANDVWSLGVILINLVSGRNPWKQAKLQDPAFATYVKQPRKFFRAILPSISKTLDRILIRIFCLDPMKRITLPELRIMILGCRTFTTTTATKITTSIVTAKKTSENPSTLTSSQIKCTKSFESTVMAYIGDYIDDEPIYCHQTQDVSSSSSITSQDDPPTPRNASPMLNQQVKNKSQQRQHFHYEQTLL